MGARICRSASQTDRCLVAAICLVRHCLNGLDCTWYALVSPSGVQAQELLRRVASRRRSRCEVSLIAAVIALAQKDKTLFAELSAQTKLKLDYVL
jgi:hypothetical protein